MKERVGNIRKIDKLGRVSIPAELRRLLHINRETLLTVEYDSILKEIKSNKKWKSFPMNETVRCLAYGEETENGTVGPYLTDEKSGDRLLPNIQRGYYLLIDRQNQNNQSKKENILDKASFNYDLGIYDMDTNTLYFCQLDT